MCVVLYSIVYFPTISVVGFLLLLGGGGGGGVGLCMCVCMESGCGICVFVV